MQQMTASRARNEFFEIQDAAILHRPTIIRRRRGGNVVLLSEDDARMAFARYPFSTEVLREAGAISLWVPELAIWGRGASLAEAKDDLLDEIDDLLERVESDARFRSAPNIQQQYGWILRLWLAQGDEERLAMLLAPPTG